MQAIVYCDQGGGIGAGGNGTMTSEPTGAAVTDGSVDRFKRIGA